MAGQIDSAQAELAHKIAELQSGGDGSALALAETQQQVLTRLQSRVAHASSGGLSTLRAEVTAYVTAVQNVAQQTRSASVAHAAERSLHAANEAARDQTASFVEDFYERKIFDPYLLFENANDEQEYRRREVERQQAIEKARAENTPEGNLRAINLSIEQLKDAGAHGADRSPDYAPMLTALTSAGGRLSAEIEAAPKQRQATANPLENLPEVQLPPELLAALGSTGVAVSDPNGTGHGVAERAVAVSSGLGRLT